MSLEDALVNFAISMVVMPPFIALGFYVLRYKHFRSDTTANKIWKLRMQLPAATLVLLGFAFILWSVINILLAL